MTQIEEKKMLAEFCGWLVNKEWTELAPKKGWSHINDLFNDYNSLMEVVEKIESLGYNVIIYKDYVRIEDQMADTAFYQVENTKLDAIYRACVEFVKWWNEQQNKKK